MAAEPFGYSSLFEGRGRGLGEQLEDGVQLRLGWEHFRKLTITPFSRSPISLLCADSALRPYPPFSHN